MFIFLLKIWHIGGRMSIEVANYHTLFSLSSSTLTSLLLTMKRLIVLSFSLSFCTTLSAQTYKDSVSQQFLRYTDLLIKKDFVKSMDYINPKFFELVPKTQMLSFIEATYNDPTFDFKIEKTTIESIEDSKTISGNEFVKFKYSNYLSIRFEANDETADTALARTLLGAIFKQENVTYNVPKQTYTVFVIKNVVATSTDKRNWTFVVVEERQKRMLEKFIPKELL